MPIYASPLNVDKNQSPSWLGPLGQEGKQRLMLARETDAVLNTLQSGNTFVCSR